MNTLLLQAAPAAANPWASIIPFVLVAIVFYFFMIRPQTKKAKDAKLFRESLKKGDKVVTIGGLHGRILEVADTTVLIDAGGAKLRFEKSALSSTSKVEENEIVQKS
jgi:preprotein translocase subunit YajC